MKINENEILNLLLQGPLSLKELFNKLEYTESARTLSRNLSALVKDGKLSVIGKASKTKYALTPHARLLTPVNLEEYFQNEQDLRKVFPFSMELLRSIKGLKIFSQEEMRKLYDREREFEVRVQHLSPCLFNKEMERLAIDLCWKSSQIEGNTYSLIQTETLLKDLREAVGKTKEEAHMLLNHKRALDYILEAPDFFKPLTVGKIENIHSILVQNLDVTRNLRKHPVGITGTNYRPLDNEFQIREAMEFMVDSVNATKNTLEKALLVLLLISYIQPFEDGNKRTARIMANSVLLADKFCPLSFRTVDPEEYRLAMLVFYEINSLIPFKKLFSEQFAFSTANYF